jgi:anti-sigma B factor antagonist
MFSADVSTRSFDGYAVVALRGELDLADAVAVAAELTAVAARERAIIVDLAGLKFIDSSGAAALAIGQRQAWRAGGDLVLAAPRRQVARLLVILGLVEAISVYTTVAEAAREVGQYRERARPMPRPRTRTAARHPCQARRPPAAACPRSRVRRSERGHGCRWRWSQRI